MAHPDDLLAHWCSDEHQPIRHGSRTGRSWWKCDLRGCSFGPGTDLRLSWRACDRWERGEGR